MGFWIGILLGVALFVTSTLLYREWRHWARRFQGKGSKLCTFDVLSGIIRRHSSIRRALFGREWNNQS